jgi:putative flippase GtrA
VVIRWMKFNAVGAIGAAVQLGALWILMRVGLHYLVATALAVETAVLHNFAWHVRWTWVDRPESRSVRSLGRFHLANGLVSLLSNLLLMRVFAGWLGMPVLAANVLAIGLTSILNFLMGDRWVFSTKSADRRL